MLRDGLGSEKQSDIESENENENDRKYPTSSYSSSQFVSKLFLVVVLLVLVKKYFFTLNRLGGHLSRASGST